MNLDALPLHFVRPAWLWLLLALPLVGWMIWRRRTRSDVWEGHIDPHLRAHVLEAGGRRAPREAGWPAPLPPPR